MTETVHPVILCGGSGTRLWPLSRKSYPKQFSQLFPGGSLFQRTLARVEGETFAAPLLLAHHDFRFIVGEQLAEAGVTGRIMVEPEGRNTAPAIAIAALALAEADPQALMLVLPADHVLHDLDAFHAAVAEGAEAARAGHAVTFGITPDRPETGYGYIELDGPPGSAAQPFRRFVEKPDRARAEAMLAEERYLWNSGMFLFTAETLLTAMHAHAPEILRACQAAWAAGEPDLDFVRIGEAAYADAPDISIDYAVMEKIEGMVVPLAGGWNDLGSWQTVWAESAPDEAGVAAGEGAVAIGCRDTLLRTEQEGMRVVGIGLDGIGVIAMRDAVLAVDLARAQDVRLAVDALRAEGAAQADEFPRYHRPWGWYETLARGTRFQVKQIVVRPGGRLSLQSHLHRAEHWVVVEGTAEVTIGGEVRLLAENQSVYVPLGARHRLANPGKVELRLIEVQSGAYLGEDDITRYEDVYARA